MPPVHCRGFSTSSYLSLERDLSRKLLKSTAVVSAMTMISRVLGFVRDIVVARLFGADSGTDAFFLAFKIPNFLRRLFAEGAFSQAFVPVLAEYKEKRTPAELKDLVDRVAGTLGGVLLLMTTVGVIAAPLLVMAFGPGFVGQEGKFALAADMLRITFPYLFFIALTAFAGGILNSFGRFGVPAFTPVFLNLCMIAAAFWLTPYNEPAIVALAWGVFLAGVVQLVFQFPFLMRLGLMPRPRWGWRHEGVSRILRLMLPAIFGSSVAQVNLLLDTILASFLVSGSISWLYYSDRLVEFPLGVFGIALATVILPKLSKDHANGSPEKFTGTLDWGLRLTFLIGMPATVGLVVLAGPLMATLFFGGEFKQADVHMASLSLMTFSLGLLGFIAVKVLAPAFYARQDTKTPVKIGIVAVAANMVFNAVIVLPMVLLDVPGAHAGLAGATAFAAFVNAGMLYGRLRRDGVYTPLPGWAAFLGRVGLASVMTAGVLWRFPAPIEQWLQWSTLTRGLSILEWVTLGAGVYLATLWATGMKFKALLKASG